MLFQISFGLDLDIAKATTVVKENGSKLSYSFVGEGLEC